MQWEPTSSLKTDKPLGPSFSKRDSGVFLIMPFAVSNSRKVSSVKSDTASMAVMWSDFPTGSTWTPVLIQVPSQRRYDMYL